MMKVGFNPVSFKGNEQLLLNSASGQNIDKKTFENFINDDKILLAPAVKNDVNSEKKSSLNESVADVWKFISVANQMANASLKGLFYGTLTGVSLLTGSWIFKSLPKAFSKEGPTLWQTLRHPINSISKSGKVIAGIGSSAVLAYHLVKGKLDANQKTAVIDHKLKVGHRDV